MHPFYYGTLVARKLLSYSTLCISFGHDIRVCTKCHFLRLGISAPLIPKPLSTLE